VRGWRDRSHRCRPRRREPVGDLLPDDYLSFHGRHFNAELSLLKGEFRRRQSRKHRGKAERRKKKEESRK
jgi:hypothetical protein